MAEKHGEPLKLALVAADIPISRQGIDNMEQLAKKLGQTGLLSQCHHRDQPGTRHEVVVVEHRRISHEVVRH